MGTVDNGRPGAGGEDWGNLGEGWEGCNPAAARLVYVGRESAFIARESADDRRSMPSPELLARIEAAQAAVLSQVDLLHRG